MNDKLLTDWIDCVLVSRWNCGAPGHSSSLDRLLFDGKRHVLYLKSDLGHR